MEYRRIKDQVHISIFTYFESIHTHNTYTLNSIISIILLVVDMLDFHQNYSMFTHTFVFQLCVYMN